MSVVKKQLDIDSILIDKLNKVFGNSYSLTFIVENLLWALVNEVEDKNFNIHTLIKDAAKNAREVISESSEIPPHSL